MFAAAFTLGCTMSASAMTNVFFHAPEVAVVVGTNMTDTTIRSSGYLFTYSVDGWWSATPGGPPTGRMQPVQWPEGIDAQSITTGPTAGVGASISIRRADGQPFELRTFTGKLLLNTAGAGAAFELMPQLNGNDAFVNPLTYDCTGIAGMSFPYAPALTGYDTYILSMWGDFALTQLTVADASAVTQPALQISMTSSNYVRITWPTNSATFMLLQNSSLAAGDWIAVTNPVSLAGTNNEMNVPASAGASFFRLIY